MNEGALPELPEGRVWKRFKTGIYEQILLSRRYNKRYKNITLRSS
jgi:hypothetical protein